MGDDHFDVLVIARKCAEQFNPKPANCVHPVRRKAAETLLRKRTEIIAKELLAALRSTPDWDNEGIPSPVRDEVELGNLVDRWDMMANDTKGYLREVEPAFCNAIERIAAAIREK